MQDIKGSAQGNWFTYPALQIAHGQGGEEKQLALIHNNVDPNEGEISVGGTITASGQLMFTPPHSGTINRDFGEITADNAVYCYTSDSSSSRFVGRPINGKIFVQLVNANQLKVEYRDGSCGATEQFNNPTTYSR